MLQGGSYHAECHIGINTGARGIMNQQYRTRLARSALERVQASGDRCGSCLATWNNGNDRSRNPRECGVVGDTIVRGDHDNAPNASGGRERLERPAQRGLAGNGDE